MLQFVALFGAGIASFLAPCILPLLPAYLGIIVGETADAHDAAKAVPATAVFVLGFATVFAAFGAAAGLLGSSLHQYQGTVERVGGVVIALMGLVLLGVVRGPFARERRLVPTLPGRALGTVRPFVVGIAFGAAWSPCVGPTLGAASVLAAQGQDLAQVALVMGAFGLGAALPLLVLGMLSRDALLRWRNRLMEAGKSGKLLLGGLLVLIGVIVATGLDKQLEALLVAASPDWLTELTTRF